VKLIISLIFIFSSCLASASDHRFIQNGLTPEWDEFRSVDTNSVSCSKVQSFVSDLNSQLGSSQQLVAKCKTITKSNGIFQELESDQTKTILQSASKLCRDPKINYAEPDKYFDIYVDQITDGDSISPVGEFILNEFGIEVVYENDNPYGLIRALIFPVCP
jgi:hypothetical protein